MHVTPPVGEDGGAIEISAGNAKPNTFRAGKESDSEPWLEKLEHVKGRWKATLRKGIERVEMLAPMSPQQVEIRATFIET